MAEKTSLYHSDYTELKCIGRGNFGSAFLVENKSTGVKSVAKKIMLGQLPEKEQQNALLEVNLLRFLDHPNIVEYIGSYIEKGTLIIIMEYWDVGDLSYHIKRKKKKGEHFTEDEILNWFIQISMALDYIHGRKVLHRDIKASNIFLTGNNTVKLGDFGISRVLENTWDAAMTCVGTPYYMSPEVWENKPYTYKSDVWALGCVLYELCTLEHAFSADNLLGLVYKIVQDKYEPIPKIYSDDLNSVIEILLVKDSEKRPLVADLLMTPFAKTKMEEFINNGGYIGEKSLFVKPLKTKRPREEEAASPDHSSHTIEESKHIDRAHSMGETEDDMKGLTHRERIKLKKQKIADERAKKMEQAARGAISNYSNAKERMYNDLYKNGPGTYHSGHIPEGHKSQADDSTKIKKLDENKQKYSQTSGKKHGIAIGNKKDVMVSNFWADPIKEQDEFSKSDESGPKTVLEASDKFEDSFAANDRDGTIGHSDTNDGTFMANDRDEGTFVANDRDEGTFVANDREDGTFVANDRLGASKFSKGEDTYKLSESNGTMISGLSLEDSSAKTIKALQKHVSYDDRVIKASGKYDLDEYYYNNLAYNSDEFEDDDDDATMEDSKKEAAEQDPQELTWIMDNYKNFLAQDNQGTDEINNKFLETQEKLNEGIKNSEEIPIEDMRKLKMENDKMQIQKILGEDLYKKVYKYLKEARKKKVEDKVIQKKVRKMIPKNNSKLIAKWSELDMIIYMETQRGQ